MSRGARAGLLGVAVVILVVAFVALRPSANEQETTADAPTATPTALATATLGGGRDRDGDPHRDADAQADCRPRPAADRQQVVKIRVDKGDTVRFRVRSPEDEEIHIHGYDIKRDLKAGQTANINFKATIDGIFEIEFENAASRSPSSASTPRAASRGTSKASEGGGAVKSTAHVHRLAAILRRARLIVPERSARDTVELRAKEIEGGGARRRSISTHPAPRQKMAADRPVGTVRWDNTL